MENDTKLRPFYITKSLYERTDEELFLTTNQFIDILKTEYNISVHRQTIAEAIKILQKVGMDIDAVNTESRKISFYHFHYNKKKRVLKNDGHPYVFSPYHLVWTGDYYYMVGWSDKHGKITTFRIDRIKEIPDILDKSI